MIVEFCRWGNSLAVRIPKAVADALKVSSGKRAEIRIENGTLVLRPILKPARKPRYTLDELLSGMTRDNVPQEVDWGPQRGNEAWWRPTAPRQAILFGSISCRRSPTSKPGGARRSCFPRGPLTN